MTAFLEWAGKLAQDVHNDEPYTIAGMLLLAMGGWFYLRSPWLWQRALALFAGRTLAMAIAATGKAIIYSSSGWPHFAYLFTWQTEAIGIAFLDQSSRVAPR